MTQITIADYGIGNILSVERAFTHCGATVIRATTPEQIEKSDRLVVPGVGAFHDCAQALQKNNLWESTINFAKSGKPYLGICVGMQMMLDVGEEFGTHAGMGLIPGKVTQIEKTGTDGTAHKIPFIGWKSLKTTPHSATQPIEKDEKFYFVHSFKAVPAHDQHILASYDYDGLKIPAIIGQENMIGIQFHPEKSGPVGLKIIKNFLKS